MKQETTINFGDERLIMIRLTALWALNEAGLGGLMHLFRSPFTGIFVGGSAILLIALIAHFSKKPGAAILRALLLVLIIKGVVSPHSPLPAYLAVSFQGLLGALLFSRLSSFRLAALLLGALGLLEAALQKLLVTTLLFGMPIWKAIDAFVDSVLQKFGVMDTDEAVRGSLWLIGWYIGLYFVSGLLIGWLAGRLPAEVKTAAGRLSVPEISGTEDEPSGKRPHRAFWQKPALRWIAFLLLLLTAIYLFAPASREVLAPLWLLVRVVGVIAVWYFLLAPLLMRLLQRFLQKKASEYREEVAAALELLPVFRVLAKAAWAETRPMKGWRRWKEFAIRIITYALLYSGKKS
ncbi:MAG: hypothetical protein ACKV1O_04820 [Saprospiraceae bacterium]